MAAALLELLHHAATAAFRLQLVGSVMTDPEQPMQVQQEVNIASVFAPSGMSQQRVWEKASQSQVTTLHTNTKIAPLFLLGVSRAAPHTKTQPALVIRKKTRFCCNRMLFL